MKKNIKVLLIDEEGSDEKSFDNVLIGLKIRNITKVTNAVDAIEKHKTEQFDLTFFNGQMTDMPGLELLKKIRVRLI
jgi:CheY-like chemotaxis protein